jgi:hypothetical protein
MLVGVQKRKRIMRDRRVVLLPYLMVNLLVLPVKVVRVLLVWMGPTRRAVGVVGSKGGLPAISIEGHEVFSGLGQGLASLGVGKGDLLDVVRVPGGIEGPVVGGGVDGGEEGLDNVSFWGREKWFHAEERQRGSLNRPSFRFWHAGSPASAAPSPPPAWPVVLFRLSTPISPRPPYFSASATTPSPSYHMPSHADLSPTTEKPAAVLVPRAHAGPIYVTSMY